MESMTVKQSIGKILCCECGTPIDPNPSNQCIGCIRTKVDITEDIPKSAPLCFCRGCERYLDPPSCWLKAALESRELLRLCLKKVKGLNQVRLVNAGFLWTEEHSKRIKVKLTVEKEIHSGAVLQQQFVIEFIIQHQLCDECHRVEAKDYWNSLIQLRQKTDHKRTFYYLEQLIAKHRVHTQTSNIKAAHGGMDFYFGSEQASNKMLDFLTSVVPCKWTKSKKLKSHDIHSNTYNYKITYSVEIVPICKDSVVCLPAKLSHQLGGISQLCIVLRVTNNIFLIDPSTAQVAEVSNALYWRSPFNAVCSSKKLTEFIVIDINEADVKHFKGQGQVSKKHKVVELWVQRAEELGVGNPVFCLSHLGNVVRHGDSVLGYDLKNSNVNDSNMEKLPDLPDVIIVKKIFGDRATRNRKRKWKLRHLGIDDDISSQNRDYIDFLEDLEEDPTIRANINIYRNEDKV
ncbi:60S ribosomal export protein NMD3 [Armadillidium nasatum]|uniref:60S ribosomal export protein NMD3 n=2 Tax=Armadillidium nasatum TaxID=96803 RepID=A0A5N5T8M0_9CRUS|nr:60S ribosomal export protein NMD3 [Armadillidium nasatum]